MKFVDTRGNVKFGDSVIFGNNVFMSEDTDGRVTINTAITSGAGSALVSLVDVNITSPIDTQVLQYQAGSAKWINATTSFSTALVALTDVIISIPTNSQSLVYQNSTSKWVNSGVSLNTLFDVGLTSPATSQSLVYQTSTGRWVNSGVSLNTLFDVSLNNPTNSQALVYRTATGTWVNSGISAGYWFNVRDYGAVGDGITNDTVAIQATIDAASARVVTDTTPAHVTGAAVVLVPPGKYKTNATLHLSTSGMWIKGYGSSASIIVPSAGGDGLVCSGGANYLRHIGLEGFSIDYSGITMASGTTGIKIDKCTDTCSMTDLQVLFPQNNSVTNLYGITFRDSESWSLRNIWVGWLRGVDSIGMLFDTAGLTRGNMVFENVVVRDAYIGWKNIGTSSVANSLVFNSFKVINSSGTVAIAPQYGIWVAGQTYGMTFNDLHVEGTQGGVYNFAAGIFLDATSTAIRNVKINNPILQRVTNGIVLSSGTVQHCRVMDARFMGTETVTNAVTLGSSVTDCWVLGLTAQQTVTNWLVDGSAANSGNLFQWNLGGGSAGYPLLYKGAYSLVDSGIVPSTYTGIVGLYTDVGEGPIKSNSGSGAVRWLNHTVFADHGKSTTSTSDTSLTSYSLPAGVLSANNQAVKITARGRQATQAGSFNVKFGSTVIATLVPAAGDNWNYDATVVRASATSQLANVAMATNATVSNNAAFPAELMSVPITIDFRGSTVSSGTLRLDYAAIQIV